MVAAISAFAARRGPKASSASPAMTSLTRQAHAARQARSARPACRAPRCRLMRSRSSGRPATASMTSAATPPGRSSRSVSALDLDDGGFHADRGRPAIDDERDPVAEICLRRLRRSWPKCGPRSWRWAPPAAGRTPRSALRRSPAACAARPCRGRRSPADGWPIPARAAARASAGPARTPRASFSRQRVDDGELRAMTMPETWAISGLKRGRPLASKMRATASPLVASPARP